MQIKEYQFKIQRTRNKTDYEIANYSMGLAGETGELVDMIKKSTFHGHELNMDNVVKEMGDIAWYLCNLANILNIDMELVLDKNIEKLEKRYSKGFTVEESKKRIDVK